MNDLTIKRAGEGLPSLVSRAANILANAKTDAETLEAFNLANAGYRAAQLANSEMMLKRAKRSHDNITSVAHRVQADTLQIMAQAQARIADAYDLAQQNDEIASAGNPNFSSAEKLPGAADLGLSPKFIHEARTVRDALTDDPEIIKQTVEAALERGEEPTKTMVRQVVARRPAAPVSVKGRELDRLTRAWRDASADVQRLFLQKHAAAIRSKFPDIFGAS